MWTWSDDRRRAARGIGRPWFRRGNAMNSSRHACQVALAALFWAALGACAQAQIDPIDKTDKDKTEKIDKTAKPEKLVSIEMRSMPWSRVFEWLTDQTGLP